MVIRKMALLALSLAIAASTGPFTLCALADSAGLHHALESANVYHGNNGARVNLVDKQAVVEVFHYAADSTARRKAAIFAARALVNYAPAQFTTVAVKYFDGSSRANYSEIIVNARDITSLSVGTAKLEDLIAAVPQIDITSSDNQTSIFNKYLGAAEKQIEQGHFWEAEQMIDAVSRTHGTPHDASGRFTKDMITLADGFDTWGDPDRSEKVLRKIVEHRETTNSLTDADADRSIEHLVDLLIDNKREKEAEELLTRLLNNPSLSQTSNPEAYAANLERLALCHLKLGQHEQAERELAQVISLKEQGGENPRLAQAFEKMGDVYRGQGKRNEALSYYKKARAIYDKAVVSRKMTEKIDYQVYNAHLRQIDDKLKQL